MECVVLSWIFGTISASLVQLVMSPGTTARRAWLSLEDQFLGNKETRALYLDAEFRNFTQGDLNVSDYCRRLKAMADALGDLGEPVQDRTLVLAVLRGLNERFAHLASLIRRAKPFPSFVGVRSDLLLEELTMQNHPVVAPIALVATGQPASTGRRGTNNSTAIIVAAVATPAATLRPLPLLANAPRWPRLRLLHVLTSPGTHGQALFRSGHILGQPPSLDQGPTWLLKRPLGSTRLLGWLPRPQLLSCLLGTHRDGNGYKPVGFCRPKLVPVKNIYTH